MTVYCNVQECGNWEKIEKKVRQPKGIGYVPIGDIGLYSGQCSLNRVDIVHKELKGAGGGRYKLSLCDNFSKEKSELDTDSVQVTCLEKECRFNVLESSQCEQLDWHGDLYIDTATVQDGIDQTTVPVCKSHVIRKREGFINFARYV